jgi:hypothetical protein
MAFIIQGEPSAQLPPATDTNLSGREKLGE